MCMMAVAIAPSGPSAVYGCLLRQASIFYGLTFGNQSIVLCIHTFWKEIIPAGIKHHLCRDIFIIRRQIYSCVPYVARKTYCKSIANA